MSATQQPSPWPPAVAPLLWDEIEVAIALRLLEAQEFTTEPEARQAARRRVNRLVDQGKLRPCLVGGKRRYSPSEVQRFIDVQTDRYAALDGEGA